MLIYISQFLYFTFNISFIKDSNNYQYIEMIYLIRIFTERNQQFFIIRCWILKGFSQVTLISLFLLNVSRPKSMDMEICSRYMC